MRCLSEMKNRYETNEELATLAERINVHKTYAKYEINDWILKMINLKSGERVVDVGCGSGKQTIEYAKIVGKDGIVVGIDISEDILKKAKELAEEEKVAIQLVKCNANNISFVFTMNDFFSLISCCFAIYYLEDIQKFLLEVKRKLRSGGRVFVVGPTLNNAKEMQQVHSKVFNEKLPQIYEKRMKYEVIPCIKRHFANVKIGIFNNILIFPTTTTFLNYYKSTLLFRESIKNKNDEFYLKRIKDEVDRFIIQNGKFELHKQVYGIIGYK